MHRIAYPVLWVNPSICEDLAEGDLAGVTVPQLDPRLQDLLGSGGGLVDHPEEELFP